MLKQRQNTLLIDEDFFKMIQPAHQNFRLVFATCSNICSLNSY